MSEKICQCGKPTINQTLPEAFSGTVKCAKCDGIANVGKKQEKPYKGNDPVEGLLHDLNISSGGQMTFEQALLTMLMRIETALTDKNSKVPKG